MDRYELAAQRAGKGLWDWDLTTSRLHYSSGWSSLLGCAESECDSTSEEWFKRIHPEDREPVQREIASLLENGSTQFEIQHRMLHQDGCYRWMSCRGLITRDDTGRAIRISGCHVDITSEVGVDALTGLPNRLLLLDRLTRSIEKARIQEDFLYAVLIVDLDLFESGISRLETANSDSLVIAAARRLEAALRTKDGFSRERQTDLIARTGGEEFIVLLEWLSDLEEARRVSERLLKVILVPFPFEGREAFLSASIGISLSATGYRNPEEALRDASAALYRAKSLGKSRSEIFDTSILESTQIRNQLKKDLDGALSRNEFVVYYQPIVSLSSDRIAGFEALARWEHPSRGMLSPAEFIPVAEKTGFISSLNRWILREACRQLGAWRQNPRISKSLWISVNLSGVQFTQSSVADEIGEVLLEAGIGAGGLVLELTEGMVMRNPEAARSLLMRLRIMGTRIALDDFGTGYSSLAYLRRFPLDYLKIDASFVKSIENSSDALGIIRTIKSLAHQLGLRVIAEGIENPGQLDLIRSLGCDYGQGFLFSKAVRGEEAESQLLNGYAAGQKEALRTTRPEQSDDQAGLSPDSTSEPVVVGSSSPSGAGLGFWSNRRGIALGLAVLVLLALGGLLARRSRPTAPSAADTSGPAKPVAVAVAGKAAAPAAISEVPPAPMIQELPVTAPAPAKTRTPETVYSYPVEHDHRLGSCKGMLRISRDTISFISENNKHGFAFKYSECSCTLDKDQLTIRAGSKVFRFKSATAFSKDENRSHLSGMFQKIQRPGN
jgi:diguanylate cyclase (GGDEF)-like protein